MCRPGRCCPHHRTPYRRALENLRRRLTRHERTRRRALRDGDTTTAARQVAALERDVRAYAEARRQTAPVPPAPSVPAPGTSAATEDLLRSLATAPPGPDEAAILAELERRCAPRSKHERLHDHALAVRAWRAWQQHLGADTSPLTDPAARDRTLSAEEMLLQRYEAWVHERAAVAGEAHPESLLTDRATALGLDVALLHRLPGRLAGELAGQPLRAWWHEHGRITAARLLAWSASHADGAAR